MEANKKVIIDLLQAKHDDVMKWLDKNGELHWETDLPGKWSSGQIILHIIQGETQINRALKMPKFLLRYKFGKPNRPARTYEEIIDRYQEKLDSMQEGVVSPFSTDMTLKNTRQEYITQYANGHDQMIKALDRKWSEKQLWNTLLPHPLMGRMHVGELLMWNAYHREHHLTQLEERASI